MKNTTLGSQRPKYTFHRVISIFGPCWWQCILILLTIIVTQVLGVVSPLIIGQIIDQALPQKNLALLTLLVAESLGAAILAGFISIGQDYLKVVVGQSVVRDLRIQLYTHLQHASLRFFTTTRAGDILSRFSNDCDGIQTTVTITISTFLTNIIMSFTTLIALFALSWQLTLVSLFLLPLFLYPTYRMGIFRRKTSTHVQETLADTTSQIEETLNVSVMLLIKNFGRQQAEIERFTSVNKRLMALQVRQYMMNREFYLLFHLFFALAPSLIYYIGGRQVIGGTLSVGSLVAFAGLQARLFPPLGELLNLHLDLQGALALFDRIFAYLDVPIEIADKPNAISLPTADGHIRFRHVSFKYQHDNVATPTLNNIDFEIHPGQLVALVGPTGAGKTTISYLLSRLYDVDSGAIELDGHDIRNVQLASLSQHIGVVTQESYMLNTTIRENIRYGCPNASEAEVIAAARDAHIHEHIMTLPKGYDTIIGTRGYTLSGGEKQRLALARVILKNPRILILDEATSALDSQSERLIQATLKEIFVGRTALVIAHRLSTIVAADQILVLDTGRIIERGTHHELIKCGGLYTKLYNELHHETVRANGT